MRRRLGVIALFLLGALVYDRVLGAALHSFFPRSGSGQIVGFGHYALENPDYDLMIFGSSRAQHQIDPSVLESELGLRSLNAGVDGQGIAYARAMEVLLLARGTAAKVFVLNMDVTDMVSSDLSPVVTLAPFWGESDRVDEMLRRSTSHANLKFLSSSYRFNSRALPLLANLTFRSGRASTDGFSPIHRVMAESENVSIGGDWFLKGADEMDPFKMSLYRNFLRAARDSGVQVMVVVGPRYWPDEFEQDPRLGPVARLSSVARSEGAEFFLVDGFENEKFSSRDWYADSAHLNAKGARMYSELLAHEISIRLNSQ
jgi:hypothetical protein